MCVSVCACVCVCGGEGGMLLCDCFVVVHLAQVA